MIQNLAAISDEKLIGTLKEFRKSENVLVADIVRYLVEIDSRQLYCEDGYSSLFHFCTKGLEYSEGAAHRRIVAARCMRANPEVYEMLREGKISLCALSEVAKVITPENKTEILTLSQVLPKQEAQRLAAHYQVATPPKRETIKAKKTVVAVPRITVTGEVNVGSTATPCVDSPNTQTESSFTSPVAVEERFSLSFEVDAVGSALKFRRLHRVLQFQETSLYLN